jgi:hypothetical protein
MEPFVDFGLFEVLFVFGLTAVAVYLYARKFARMATMAIGVLAPIAMAILSNTLTLRVIAFICIVTGLVNTYVLIVASQNSELVAALKQSQIELRDKAKGFMRKISSLVIHGS